MIYFGEIGKYRIGEIAELAGVSRRTIDYYTNLGLLSTVRSENNYRYYSHEDLIRLKLIESMKMQRYTLEEIKEILNFLDVNQEREGKNIKKGAVNIDFLKEQLKQLEVQLSQLQPATANLDANQASLLSKQIFLKSMTLMQAMIMYINEIAPMI